MQTVTGVTYRDPHRLPKGSLRRLPNLKGMRLLTKCLLLPRNRGSKFLKRWMEFLEDNADLRYPDLASLNRNV